MIFKEHLKEFLEEKKKIILTKSTTGNLYFSNVSTDYSLTMTALIYGATLEPHI